ncbi:MAG: hypothetical protein ACRBEE_15075 [Arenicella sp.]
MKKAKSLILLSCILSCTNVVNAGVLNSVVRMDVAKEEASTFNNEVGDFFTTIVSVPGIRVVNPNAFEVPATISIQYIGFAAATNLPSGPFVGFQGEEGYTDTIQIPANGTYRYSLISFLSEENLSIRKELCNFDLQSLLQSFKTDLNRDSGAEGGQIESVNLCRYKDYAVSISWPEESVEEIEGKKKKKKKAVSVVDVSPLFAAVSSDLAVIADYTNDEFQGQYVNYMISAVTGEPSPFVLKASSTTYTDIK